MSVEITSRVQEDNVCGLEPRRHYLLTEAKIVFEGFFFFFNF